MKKALLFLLFFFIIVLIIIFLSCEYFTLMSQKEWAEKSEQEDNVIIYVGGWFNPGAGNKPCYWKITEDNIKRVDLESLGTVDIASAIFVQGNTVYTCGYQFFGAPASSNPCFWVNKRAYFIEEDLVTDNSLAVDLYVKNGIVFTTGNASGNACNWVNLNKNNINIQTANSIFIQQNSSGKHRTYIGGQNMKAPPQACYWVDGKVNDLPLTGALDSTVMSIIVIGDTVYTCGNVNGNSQASLWINKNLIVLPGSGVIANSVFVSNEDIYVAGETNIGEACYWKNNNFYILSISASAAFSICVYNDVSYIAGYNDNGGERACYWLNDEIFYLETTMQSRALDIFVKADNKN